jgi:hypothetical protein
MKYNDPQNRVIIGGIRYCGKTTELIKMAARFSCLIVCASKERARNVDCQARDMGFYIEPPQDIHTLISRPELLQGRNITILVDDVEDVLEAILRQSVKVMSTSANLEPMKCLGEDENDAT